MGLCRTSVKCFDKSKNFLRKFKHLTEDQIGPERKLPFFFKKNVGGRRIRGLKLPSKRFLEGGPRSGYPHFWQKTEKIV